MTTTITIGREEGTKQPRLCLKTAGSIKLTGTPGSVSLRVSREHCLLEVDTDSRKILRLSVIPDDNFMYVNGVECRSKRGLQESDTVELGPDMYRLDLSAVLRECLGTPAVDISHLRGVYEAHKKELTDMQIRQGQINAFSSLPMVFSMGSGILAAAVEQARIIGIALALVFMIGFGILRLRLATGIPRRKEAIDDRFRKNYSCPHCGKFLGALHPDDLAKTPCCPYCKAKWKC